MATAVTEVTERDLSVGTGIFSHEELMRLPIGAEIGPELGRHGVWRKVDATTWTATNSAGGEAAHYKQFSLAGYNKVVSLPTGKPTPYLSLKRWQFWFLDHSHASAEQAGVYQDTVEDVMRGLGLDREAFPVGAGMRFRSRYVGQWLPEGTVAYVGDPEGPVRMYGVFRKTGSNSWNHILGDSYSWSGLAMTVESVPSGAVAEWASESGTEAEQDEIAAFKARAWRAGWKVKLHHRWCSTYESYMAQIGLTPEAVRGVKYSGIGVGEMVPPEQAAMLPPGSVLRWRKQTDPDKFTWFVRDDAFTNNRAWTRRLFGTDDRHRNYASVMEVLWIGEGGDWSIPLTREEVRALPPGSRIDMQGTSYLIAQDGNIQPDGLLSARGTWTLTEFSNVEMRLVGAS